MEAINQEAFVVKKLEASDINNNNTKQLKALFEQLNASIPQRDPAEIVRTKETVFLVCWHNTEVVGMALMATYKVISGHKGMIEDVVVNEQYRGMGTGKKLIQTLLKEARTLNLSEILLFSGHHRKAAISLYESLGFKLKDSGLYCLRLNQKV